MAGISGVYARSRRSCHLYLNTLLHITKQRFRNKKPTTYLANFYVEDMQIDQAEQLQAAHGIHDWEQICYMRSFGLRMAIVLVKNCKPLPTFVWYSECRWNPTIRGGVLEVRSTLTKPTCTCADIHIYLLPCGSTRPWAWMHSSYKRVRSVQSVELH